MLHANEHSNNNDNSQIVVNDHFVVILKYLIFPHFILVTYQSCVLFSGLWSMTI